MNTALQVFLDKFQEEVMQGQIQKAASPLLTTSMNSASLRRELADRFINLVVDESVLIKDMARLHRTQAPSGDITKLNISGYVTRGISENTAGTETRKPSDSVLTFTTTKLQSILDVTGEWLEDNVEGQSGRGTVLDAFFRAIANDWETLAIEGDSTAAGATDYAALVSANDGWHVLTASGTGAHIVDAGGMRASYQLLSNMLRAMPTKYKGPGPMSNNNTGLRWLVSWGSLQSMVDEQASRSTVYGDLMRQMGNGQMPTMLGIPLIVVPKIPENLTLTGTSGTTGSFIWLIDPKNLIMVVQREMKVEWERVPRSDHDELTIHMRVDFLVENTDAVVKATDLGVHQSLTLYA